MVCGIVVVAVALLLFAHNQREAKQAGESVEGVLPKVLEHIWQNPSEEGNVGAEEIDTPMTEVEIDGYNYIGYLSIPSLDLELPIMSDWDNARLKIAPCRYAGSTRKGAFVIAAHNYIKHFGLLSKLELGDIVYFVDMDGVNSTYEVVEVDALAATAVEEMVSDEFDLTLFTCTYGREKRITVRCMKAWQQKT